MRKKIFSVLFALVLAVSLILVPATVSTAATVDYNAAVIKAADRLVDLQNSDGGFAWVLTEPASASGHNVLGITAIGILKAHELDDKSAYEIALAKAYKYAMENPPIYTWDVGKYIESEPKGVDSAPDITFLIGLANAANLDSSLLTAIQGQVPGTTPADIATLAKTRWDGGVLHLGSDEEAPPNGDATGWAIFLRDWRHGEDLDALIPWGLEAGVKATLALNTYYSGQGYDQQAVDIANVLFASVDVEPYFSSTDEAQTAYVSGLSGAIEAFEEVGLYPDKVTILKPILIDLQHSEGYWNWHHATSSATMAVQDTAYAVMALLKEGGADAVVAAQKGVDWLVSSQLPEGGWNAEGGIPPEYLEVDSEAAWAIKTVLDISSSISMTASYTAPLPPSIGISVTPTSINFGAVVPGVGSATQTVTVRNTGTVAEDFSASLTDISTPDVYTPGLKIDTFSVAAWLPTGVEVDGIEEPPLVLTVPSGTAPGTYKATLVFWAEAN